MKDMIVFCPKCGSQRIGAVWIHSGDERFKRVGQAKNDIILIEESCLEHLLSLDVSVEFVLPEDLRNFQLFSIGRKL